MSRYPVWYLSNIEYLYYEIFFIGCSCHDEGSEGTTCSSTGQCDCKPNINGTLCDQCVDLMYGFPNCQGIIFKNISQLDN